MTNSSLKTNRTYYRLPCGKNTTSVNVYLKEWQKITTCLKNRFDLTCVGFDPDLCVSYKGGRTFDMPVDFAMSLIKARN